MPTSARRQRRRLPQGLALFTLVAACTRYEPRPVDAIALAEAWRALDPAAATTALPPSTRPDGFDLSDGISLPEAETLALFFNADLRRTRLEAGVPLASAQHARLWEDPTLGIDGEWILDDVDDPLVLNGMLSLTIPLSGQPGVRQKLAQAEASAAEIAVVGAEWALLSLLRRQWAAASDLAERRALLAAGIEEFRAIRERAVAFQAAGALTAAEAQLLDLRHQAFRQQALDLEAEADQARLQVIGLLGLHPAQAWQLALGLPDMPTTPAPPPDATHPDLRLALAAYAIAERRLELEVRKQYPDLVVGLGGGSDQGVAQLGFGLGLLPLPIWNRNQEGIATATAERAVQEAAINAALQDLAQRRAQADAALAAAQRRLALQRDDIAPLVASHIDMVQRLIGAGRLDIHLLAAAVEQAIAHRLDFASARWAIATAQLDLAALAGPPALRPTPPPAAGDRP